MKVLLTGATGRVGTNLLKRLIASNIEVRALVMPGDPHAKKLLAFPEAEIMEGDLCQQAFVDTACQGVTHIVHLAAQMVLRNTPVDKFYDVNALSTLRLLEGTMNSGTTLERFVLASTDSVYRPGNPGALPLIEELETVPADYYGLSKLVGEIILRNRAQQFDLPFTILRFGTVLSPEEADNLFRLGFLRGWLRTQQSLGRRATLWPLFEGQPDLASLLDTAVGTAPANSAVGLLGPDGTPWTISMVDVRDVVQAACLALTQLGAVRRTFNIAAAQPVDYPTGAAIVSEVFDVPKHIVTMPFTWRLPISIEAARKHLGYSPKYDYRGTLQAAIASSVEEDDEFIPAAEGGSGVWGQLSGGQASLESVQKSPRRS